MGRSTADQRRINQGRKAFQEFLATEGGRDAVFYLRSFTIEAIPGANTSDTLIQRHFGKCQLVQAIESNQLHEDPDQKE